MRFALRVFVIAVAAIAVVVILSWLLRSGDGADRVTEQYTVRRGTVEETVQGTGVLESATAATITSKVKGQLGEPLVTEGERVAKDQLLMRITNDEIESLVKLKEAEITKLEDELAELRKEPEERTEVKKAKAAHDRAKNDYEKKKRELENAEATGAVKLSEQELDQLRKEVEFAERDAALAEDAYEEALDAVTEADVQQAEEKVTQAELELDKLEEQRAGREVRSPIKGTVLEVMIEPEELAVDPDKEYEGGTPLFRVANLDTLLVRGKIYQTDEAKLDRDRINDPNVPDDERPEARVQLSGLGRSVRGRVTYLSLTSQESSTGVGQFEVKISFPAPPQGVTDGLQVSFEIVVGRAENVLVLPVRFVELEGSKAYVDKVVGGKPVRTEVRLGLSDNEHYEVLDGLSEGDVIQWARTAK
jgi:HlyD family secretion protein